MILQTLVCTMLGYINSPSRTFLLGYMLLAITFICTFPYWGQADSYETLCIGSFFLPGFYALYIVNLLNIANSFHSAIIAALGVLIVIELPYVYACHRLGRYFGNKTGNLHIF